MAKKKDTLDEPSDGTIATNDAWTGMLAVSLIALVLGSLFLGYEAFFVYSEKPPEVPKFSSPSSLKKSVEPPAPKVEDAKDGAKDAPPAKDADAKKD